jgi:hypothetical protein
MLPFSTSIASCIQEAMVLASSILKLFLTGVAAAFQLKKVLRGYL